MDFFPLWLSLKVSVAATILTLATGLPVAWVLARKRFTGRDVAEALVVLPLVLPPTVLGYYLLVLIGRQGVIGHVLDAAGMELAFTWRAAVLAAWVGSSALFIKAAQAGFEAVDRRLEQAARTLGRSGWSVFWSITLPLASRAVMAATSPARPPPTMVRCVRMPLKSAMERFPVPRDSSWPWRIRCGPPSGATPWPWTPY